MKTALFSLTAIIAAMVVLFFILGVMSRSGKAPGLIDGRLSKCPGKPNCVCSEYKESSHYIEPLVIPDNLTFDTFPALTNAIQKMGGRVETESDNYIAATFSSALFGFIDDLEIRIDSIQKVIHIRSASRVGHSDMGVNRDRAELLQKLYINKVTEQARPSPGTPPESGAH
jgi:uncharacterized protein (DUF1499 family)